MSFRDSLAIHPARLPSPDTATAGPVKRNTGVIHASPKPEAVNIRESLAMHPATFPLQDDKLPPTAKAA